MVWHTQKLSCKKKSKLKPQQCFKNGIFYGVFLSHGSKGPGWILCQKVYLFSTFDLKNTNSCVMCHSVWYHMSFVMCHVSNFKCHVSCVRCQMSGVTCQIRFPLSPVRCQASCVTCHKTKRVKEIATFPTLVMWHVYFVFCRVCSVMCQVKVSVVKCQVSTVKCPVPGVISLVSGVTWQIPFVRESKSQSHRPAL